MKKNNLWIIFWALWYGDHDQCQAKKWYWLSNPYHSWVFWVYSLEYEYLTPHRKTRVCFDSSRAFCADIFPESFSSLLLFSFFEDPTRWCYRCSLFYVWILRGSRVPLFYFWTLPPIHRDLKHQIVPRILTIPEYLYVGGATLYLEFFSFLFNGKYINIRKHSAIR